MTSIVDEPNALQNPALKRISIMLSAALLPFLLAGALSGLFYLLGDYTITSSTPPKTEYASITYPERKTLVDEVFTAKGQLTKLPEKTTAYLMVKRDELYWPKKNLGNKPGEWSQEVKEAKRKRSRLHLTVLALNAQEKKVIDQWYADSKKTGKYSGIGEFTKAHEIAAIEVKQK